MDAEDAWTAFIAAAKEWAHHLDQFDRVKWKHEGYGTVYLFIGRSDPYPDNFDDLDAPHFPSE